MTTGVLTTRLELFIVLVWVENYPERTYCNLCLACPCFPMKIIFSLNELQPHHNFFLRRWVNIGKERDGMAPDAVQYARALRPPYHLLSFLRIKVIVN